METDISVIRRRVYDEETGVTRTFESIDHDPIIGVDALTGGDIRESDLAEHS